MKVSVTIDRNADGAWVVESPDFPGGIHLGKTKAAAAKKIRAVISRCLASIDSTPALPARNRAHRFASEALIGSLATGIKSGDNATLRRLARQRLPSP